MEKNNLEVRLTINDNIYEYSNIYSYINNLDIKIKYNGFIYDPIKLKEDNDKLNNLIKDVKNNELSNTEKYLAIYDIVKQFKKYKKNQNNKMEARNISSILNNHYIVCVGFSELLEELLNRVGIKSTSYNCEVDTSYDK